MWNVVGAVATAGVCIFTIVLCVATWRLWVVTRRQYHLDRFRVFKEMFELKRAEDKDLDFSAAKEITRQMLFHPQVMREEDQERVVYNRMLHSWLSLLHDFKGADLDEDRNAIKAVKLKPSAIGSMWDKVKDRL